MKTLWLRILAAIGDREARKSLNRSAGARKAAVTRRRKRTAAEPIASLNVITERTTVSRRGEPVLDDRD